VSTYLSKFRLSIRCCLCVVARRISVRRAVEGLGIASQPQRLAGIAIRLRHCQPVTQHNSHGNIADEFLRNPIHRRSLPSTNSSVQGHRSVSALAVQTSVSFRYSNSNHSAGVLSLVSASAAQARTGTAQTRNICDSSIPIFFRGKILYRQAAAAHERDARLTRRRRHGATHNCGRLARAVTVSAPNHENLIASKHSGFS
jgi:hypothetical protein